MPSRSYFVIILAATTLLLSACGASGADCNIVQRQNYVEMVGPVVDRFDALMAEAETGNYEERAENLAKMQELRQEAESLAVPACAQSDLTWYLGRMDAGIDGLSAIQAITPTPIPPTPTAVPPTATPIPSQPVEAIELGGGLANPAVEVSGMAWHGDTLVVMPQRPSQEGDLLYAIDKADILDYLDGTITVPVTPRTISFSAPDVDEDVEDFDGFEAIAFDGDRVYMLIESQQVQGMFSYLVAGDIAEDESEIVMDTATQGEIRAQSIIPEAAEETLVLVDGRLLTVYEVNEERATPSPVVHVFDTELQEDGTLPFPNVEWRITDATEVDADNRFWVMNTSFLALASESLIEFQYDEAGITRTERGAIPLELDSEPRNWEGIVRLDDRGFLIATDLDPDTILAFVAFP